MGLIRGRGFLVDSCAGIQLGRISVGEQEYLLMEGRCGFWYAAGGKIGVCGDLIGGEREPMQYVDHFLDWGDLMASIS